ANTAARPTPSARRWMTASEIRSTVSLADEPAEVYVRRPSLLYSSNRAEDSMSHNRISRALVLAIVATLTVAPASHAQIGGFLKKKAQEAAQAKVEQQNKATDPKNVAMSESDLSALFRGLDAELPKAERARTTYRRADSLDKAADALSQSHQVEYGVYETR